MIGANTASMSSRMKCRSDSRPTALTSRGSTPGRSRRQLEKVQHLTHAKSVALTLHFEHDNGALVGGPAILLQEQVSVEHGQQAATNVDQPLDRVRYARNSGGRKAGEDLTHDPCRGRADNLTDAKYDGVKRGGVSHLY
jgi:hypothetical protein